MDSSKNDENVLNFMQITECQDYVKAENYMKMANYNLEQAISLYMELEGPGQGISPQPSINTSMNQRLVEEQKYVNEGTDPHIGIVNSQIFNSQHPPPKLIKQSTNPIPSENLEKIELYRKFLKEKETNEEGIGKKIWNGTTGIIKGFCKSLQLSLVSRPKDNGAEFLSLLSKNKIIISVQFLTGNFKENLEKSQSMYRPLLLYVHNPAAMSYVKDILCNPQLSSFIVQFMMTSQNKNFSSLGFLSNSEGLQSVKEMGFNLEKFPSFFVFRRDIFEKVILMNSYELLPDTDIVSLNARLKGDKAGFNKLYIMEEQIKKEALGQNREAYVSQQSLFQPPQLYQQQSSQEQQLSQLQKQQQQLRLQQEREVDRIRQQQEAALKLAEEENKRKLIQKQQQEEQQRQFEAEQERIKVNIGIDQQQEEKMYRKAALLSNLPDEPQSNEPCVVHFSFRMPNGANMERRFKDDIEIQTLFDFISCQDEQYFETPDVEFDLIQNFPKLSLLEHKNELVKDVFQDSTMEQLIVKEL